MNTKVAHCRLISPLLNSAEEHCTELVFYLCSGTSKRGNCATGAGAGTSQPHPFLWLPPPGWELGGKVLPISRTFLRVHSPRSTNPTPLWLLVLELELLFCSVPSPVSVAGWGRCQGSPAPYPGVGAPKFPQTRHKRLSQHRTVPRGTGSVKSKFSSLRNSQAEEFPMPVPKQSPLEMLTTSPDTALTLSAPALGFI